MRGSRGGDNFTGTCGGSIPACAGKPRIEVFGGNQGEVYPRVCGEALWWMETMVSGVYPRVCGEAAAPFIRPLIQGSIPACAGKPRSPTPASGSAWVYPRVCGEAILPQIKR